jgi:hypothetical protein
MSKKATHVACFAGAFTLSMFAMQQQVWAADRTPEEGYVVKNIISVPVPAGITNAIGLGSFDISFVDGNIHRFVLADRSNFAIDVVDTKTNKVVSQLRATPDFVGVQPGTNTSGPNGVIIVDQREVWAPDGPRPGGCNPSLVFPALGACDSPVYVIDIKTGATNHVVHIPGQKRADELCENVGGETVLVANDDPVDNFLSFINTESYSVIERHKLDGTDAAFLITLNDPAVTVPTGAKIVANGIEQCKFNPRTGSYFLAVPNTTINGKAAGTGVVLRISGKAPFQIEQSITIPQSTGCTGPQGLAIGPDHQVLLGCGGASKSSLIIDDRSGSVATVLLNLNMPGEGGADEVWYNPGDNSYFIARSTPKALGVADASGLTQDADVPTETGSHSVAADMVKNQIYVPIRANNIINTNATLCGLNKDVDGVIGDNLRGCIAVFVSKGPDDKCLDHEMPVMDHDDGDDPVFMRTRCGAEKDDDHEGDDNHHDKNHHDK